MLIVFSDLLDSTIEKIEKQANDTKLPCGSNQGVGSGEADVSSPKKCSSQISYARRKQVTPTTKIIYAINQQVGLFVGLARSEIT